MNDREIKKKKSILDDEIEAEKAIHHLQKLYDSLDNPIYKSPLILSLEYAIKTINKGLAQKPDNVLDMKLCPLCGYWVEPKYLYGEEVMQEEYKYCPRCGQKLKDD